MYIIYVYMEIYIYMYIIYMYIACGDMVLYVDGHLCLWLGVTGLPNAHK